MHLATIRCNCAPAAALDVDYYVADFRLTPPPRTLNFFFQTSSAFGDLLDLSDHPLLLDIFSQGPPQLRTGLGFLFFFKVSFEKHPSTISFLRRKPWTKVGDILFDDAIIVVSHTNAVKVIP